MKRHLKKRINLAAAAAAVPTLLFSGAATALADASDGNPDVWFDRYLTNLGPTLTVHVRSHTQDPADCVYSADWVSRNFFLPGFGTQDVVIAPAVPLLRLWNVNVSCTNGKSTSLTYFY